MARRSFSQPAAAVCFEWPACRWPNRRSIRTATRSNLPPRSRSIRVRSRSRDFPGRAAAGSPTWPTSVLPSQDSFITLLTPAEPGDYNADGHVDDKDYAAWRSAYGSTDLLADGNKDGRVDAADYVIWRNHLQPPSQNLSTSLGANVPEPTAFAIVIALLPMVAIRRHLRYPHNRVDELSLTTPTQRTPE